MKFFYFFGAVLATALNFVNLHAEKSGICCIENQNGWYIGVEGGWSYIESPQTGSASLPQVKAVKEGFDTNGYNVGVRGGYQWRSFRFEEEFRYQHHHIKSITDGATPTKVPASGSRSAYAVMTNAIYDFNFCFRGALTPHIGAGIGAVGLHDQWVVPIGRCDDDTDWVFGYQAIAGLRYNFSSCIAIDLDYRYLGTTDPKFTFSGSGARAAGISGSTFNSGYSTHSIVASICLKL